MNRRTIMLIGATLLDFLITASHAAFAQVDSPPYDLVIRHGAVYDGTGAGAVIQDIAVEGDRIAALGDLSRATGRQEVDATGLAVAPGFIDMLNHSESALIADGRSQSMIRQGVTLLVFGERSMGPLNERMKQYQTERQADIKFDITWGTLGEFLDTLVSRGVSTNIASFVSALTVRENEVGFDNRPPTAEELDRMRVAVRQAMDEGAMGLTTALIYVPGVFAKTDELVELAKVASASGGMYISLMRSEGDRLLEGIDETLTIAREAHIALKFITSRSAGSRTGRSSNRRSRRLKPRARTASKSPLTCIPTLLGPRVSMRRCPRGCRRVDTMRGQSGCGMRRYGNVSAGKWLLRRTSGKTCFERQVARARSSSASRTRCCADTPARPSRRSPDYGTARCRTPPWTWS